MEKAAKILLHEYRNGTLGRTSLEKPETRAPLA
jgi:ribosome biogenesis GTPase A